MLDAQCRPAPLDGNQAVDIGVPAGVDARILGVLGEDFQAFSGGLVVDRTVGLRQMVVDRQRTLATRLVLDDGEVEVFMYDGTLQCGQGEEIPLERQAELLTSKDIQVLDSRKGTDGFLHIAVCGASTGAINIFAIKPDDLAVARELGFSLLITQEMTERLMRPAPRPAPSTSSTQPATGAIPLLW